MGVKVKYDLKSIIQFIGNSLFFLMIVFPGLYIHIKVLLMFILILTWLILNFQKNPSSFIHKNTLIIIGLFVIRGVVWSTVGLYYNNPDVFKFFPLFIVWPLVYLIFISIIRTRKIVLGLVKTMIYAHAFIVLYDGLFMLCTYFGLDFINLYSEDVVFSIYNNYSHLLINNINPFVFTYPLIFSIYFYRSSDDIRELNIKRFLILVLLIITPLFMIFTGRRILFLLVMITPILIHIFSYSISLDISKKIRKVIIKGYVFLVGATILVLGVTLDGIYEHFLKAFSSTEEPIKFQQLNLLYNSFLESPILGNGIGDVLYEPYRDRYGSSFELSYFFELNSTGVIGILTYILIFYFIFLLCFRWIKVNNDTILFGLMVGFITYLIGNFTNPFLCSYDYLWPLYIVIAYINISFLMKTDTHEY